MMTDEELKAIETRYPHDEIHMLTAEVRRLRERVQVVELANSQLGRLRNESNAERDAALAKLAEETARHEKTRSAYWRAIEALMELERTSTAEANEKGAGGGHLARISDARAVLRDTVAVGVDYVARAVAAETKLAEVTRERDEANARAHGYERAADALQRQLSEGAEKANPPDQTRCDARSPSGLCCSRAKGHNGNHEARVVWDAVRALAKEPKP